MSPLLVAWLLGPASPAAPVTPATQATAPEAEATRVVVLMPPGGDGRVTDVVASARASLPSTEVELHEVTADATRSPLQTARAIAEQQHGKGVFWFDLRNAQQFSVYVYLPERDVTLRRRVPEASQSVQAAIESMWIILRSGAISIARGVAIEMETVDPASITEASEDATPGDVPADDASQRQPAEVAPAPRPRTLGLSVSASYLGMGFAPQIAWQSGGSVAATYEVHRVVRIGLGYGLVGGMRVRDPAALRIVRHEIAASLGVGGSVTRRVGLWGRILPALGLVQWRAPGGVTPSVQPTAKLAAEGLVQIQLVPRIALDIAPGAEVGLTTFAFVLCGEPAPRCAGDARALVLAPWRVRPRARAGITASF